MKPLHLFFKCILLYVAIISLPNRAFGQNKVKLDSLNYMLGNASSDSAKVYINVALSRLYTTADLSRALHFAENAVEIAEKTENNTTLAYALLNIGNVYFNQGLFELALKQYYRYLELQKTAGNKQGIASALINIGAISLNMNNFEQARDNFKEALKTFELLQQNQADSKYAAEIVTSYNNLGIVSQNLKEHQQSVKYYQLGISLARKTLGSTTLLANLLNNLGSLYLDQRLMPEAYSAIMEALKIRLLIYDKNGQAQSYRSLAMFYIEQGNNAKALEYLYKGLGMARLVGNISLQEFLTEKLFMVYNKTANADSALKYHILLKSLNDTMNDEETQRELTRIELTTQFNEKENLRKAEQKRNETRYLMLGISLFLLLAIISLLYLLSQNRLKRMRLEKDNINLASKNLELEKTALEQELELRNKELTTNVMYQIQKNEFIQEIIGKLLSHSQNSRDQETKIIYGIIKDLEKTQEKTVWNEFELRFNQVHNVFYEKLNHIYPELSPNERRLCAFLRLNMTTKEIASITGQSIRSIEVARTRLRKKLDLTNSESGLIEFLSSI